jgi:hypothetical protein
MVTGVHCLVTTWQIFAASIAALSEARRVGARGAVI